MSASLVGSEMCIRDSRCAQLPPPLRCLAAGPARRHRCHHQLLHAEAGTVSYTHLTLPTICSV
eukprot:13969607-Alexandrium_andersonii.AAC.1